MKTYKIDDLNQGCHLFSYRFVEKVSFTLSLKYRFRDTTSKWSLF